MSSILRRLLQSGAHLMPRRPPEQIRSSKKSFWGPVITCTAASVGIFTGFAVLDARQQQEAVTLTNRWTKKKATPPEWVSRLPESLQSAYMTADQQWKRVPENKRMLYSIIAANVGVALLWRLRPMQGFMLEYFVQRLPPASPKYVSFFTSNFSHAGLAHLGINMLALSSFGSVLVEDQGANQFGSFYLTAGIASSLASYVGRLRQSTGGRSLGASGAVYACFAATALEHPDASGAFIFLPNMPIRLQTLLPALMCVDVAGLLLRWRYLDHLGHLGGALFGILYTKWGHHLWDGRHEVLERLGIT